MTEYNRMAHGTYTVSGSAPPNVKVINLPFQPDFVELVNYTAATTPTQNGVPFAKWDSLMGQGFAVIELFNATPVLTTDIVTTNGISTFSAGLMLQYGAKQQVVAIPKANPTVVQVTAHGYSVGDTVVFQGLYQTTTTGMAQIDGIPFTISAVSDANHFTIKWNSNQSNYTALSASPTGAFVKKVLYPFLYPPQDNVISALTLASTTTVVTTMYHNFEVGQEIAFRIPSSWGTTQLNSLPNATIPGSPIYGYVTSITDNWTFVCSINSTSFTAFNTNQTIASVPGLSFPQVLAVGDVNTGGNLITATSPLYPSPQFPTSTNRVATINGPAIRGAFVNNTAQGFIIGAGAGATNTSAYLGGTSGDVIYWRAFLHDMTVSS